MPVLANTLFGAQFSFSHHYKQRNRSLPHFFVWHTVLDDIFQIVIFIQFWVTSNSFIRFWKFKQLYSLLVNFKQLHSNLDMYMCYIEICIQLETFGKIPTASIVFGKWNSFIQTWVQLEALGQIGRVSFIFAYFINIWANYNNPNKIWDNWNNLIQIWVELDTF